MTYPYENLENFTLKALFDRSIALYPYEKAFGKVGSDAFTYRELNEKVQRMVALLKESGIKKHDRLLLLSENTPNWSVAYFATTYIGAVIVPVLTDFHTEDVHRIISHSEVKAAYVSKKFLKTIESSPNNTIRFAVNVEDLHIIEELSDKEYLTNVEPNREESEPSPEDLASLIYTSGTTGNSKGVMLSHKNLVTNAMSGYKHLDVHHKDVFLSVLPLAHTFECTVGMLVPVLHGASVYYIDKVPTPSVLLKAFKEVRPTMMLSVPLVIEKIYKNKILNKFNDSIITRNLYKIGFFRKLLNKIAGKKLMETFGGRLRFYGIGGAGIAPYVEQFLIEANIPYVVGYGLTETAPLLTGTLLNKEKKMGSAGVPMACVEIKIKDKNPVTGNGEIIARSPSVMMGYYKDEEKTAEVMDGEWFLTGDLGYIDEDGYLFINGRSKNVLIGPGGENIYPEQIEAIINKHPLVLDSLMLMNKEHQLIAKVHLDYENLEQEENVEKLLENMRKEINAQISSFSKMVRFEEQKEEFIKTPTKKIKRYLYQ